MKFDATGTFVGSSFVYATARDFATFGELYRRGGALADGYSDSSLGLARHARHWVAHDPEGSGPHGSTMAGTGGCGLISKAHLLPRASKVNTYCAP